MGDFKAQDTIFVDALDGEMVFTTVIPEDGGEIEPAIVAADNEGNNPPSNDDEDKLNKLM